MNIDFLALNWWAILACVIAGQVVLTIWFVVLFADPWARAYGTNDKKQHTAEIPAYTYAIGAACNLLMAVGLGTLQKAFGVTDLMGGTMSGLYVAVFFALAAAIPGYAFLKRWLAFSIAMSAQIALILVQSTILVLWP